MSRTPKIEPEMMVALSAVVIGVCALAVSLYETSLMREQQRSAVLPILELSRSFYISDETDETTWRLALHVENVGIGPALVKDFRVTVDGKPQHTWSDAMSALLNRDGRVRYGQSTINGRTVPPERRIAMFQLNDKTLAPALTEQFERLDFSACYCSVFAECWVTSYKKFGQSQSVEACVATADSFTE